MPAQIHLINTVTAAERIVYKLLVEQPLLTFNCKGIDIGPRGTLTLVTVSTPDGRVYIFDIKADPNIVLNGGLVRLIESVDNIKVLHDSKKQAECLYNQFKIRLKHIFDVQDKYADLMEKRGLPRRKLTLPALLERYNIERYTPSTKLQRLLREDRNVWCRRPLTSDMLNTAAGDVLPLLPGLYVTLYRCLGYHEEKQEPEDASTDDNLTMLEDVPQVDKYSFPVSLTTAKTRLSLPTNYLHIHLTK